MASTPVKTIETVLEDLRNLQLDSNIKADTAKKIIQILYSSPKIIQIKSPEHTEATQGLELICRHFSELLCDNKGEKKSLPALGSLLRSALKGLAPEQEETEEDDLFATGIDDSQQSQPSESDAASMDMDMDSDDEEEEVAPRRKSMIQKQNEMEMKETMENKAKVSDQKMSKQAHLLQAAMIGGRGTESSGENLRSIVEQVILRNAGSLKRLAYNYNIRHTLNVLKSVFDRLAKQMPPKVFNEQLRPDLKELGQCFGLQRKEREYFFRLWKSRTQQRLLDDERVRDAFKSATPSGGSSLLEVGLIVEIQDRHYTKHKCKVTEFEIDPETNQVMWIEATPLESVLLGTFFPSSETGSINQGNGLDSIRCECFIKQGRFELPQNVQLPVLPIGHTGVGASLPLVMLLMFMYEMGLLQIINGIIHICFVGDGTQTGEYLSEGACIA